MKVPIFYVSFNFLNREKTFENILVGASNYHHTPTPYRHHNSIPETPDTHPIKNLSTSVHSLQAIYSITSPSISTSHHHLEQISVEGSSTSPILSSINKTPAACNSLYYLNNLCSDTYGSTSKIHSSNDTTNKLSDEYIRSTYLANIITIPSDINPNDNRLPIEIRVRCIFLRVGEIDTLNERYTSEILFEASWYEKELKIGSKRDSLTGHFNPQLVVLNHMGDSLRHDVSFNRLLNKIIFVFLSSIEMAFNK
jgi:hypothetical protein